MPHDDLVVGSISIYPSADGLEVTPWIDRPQRGRGVASAALALLLEEIPDRPAHPGGRRQHGLANCPGSIRIYGRNLDFAPAVKRSKN